MRAFAESWTVPRHTPEASAFKCRSVVGPSIGRLERLLDHILDGLDSWPSFRAAAVERCVHSCCVHRVSVSRRLSWSLEWSCLHFLGVSPRFRARGRVSSTSTVCSDHDLPATIGNDTEFEPAPSITKFLKVTALSDLGGQKAEWTDEHAMDASSGNHPDVWRSGARADGVFLHGRCSQAMVVRRRCGCRVCRYWRSGLVVASSAQTMTDMHENARITWCGRGDLNPHWIAPTSS